MERKDSLRESGIELLKIIAIFLIVISHVTQTLYTINPVFPSNYVLELKYASKNIQHLILTWFSIFGSQGNLVFFVSSVWFLLDSKKNNPKKVSCLLFDVWIMSVFFLMIFKFFNFYPVSLKEIIKSIFPSIFALNWYVTCYLLLYLIYPYLNEIIYKRTKKELLTCVLTMSILYQGINYIHHGHFFTSSLIEFIIIYFEVAYIKIYLKKYNENIKINIIILLLSTVAVPILIIFTNFLGMNITFFQDKLLHWGGNHCPFILINSICLFNIFQHIKFHNKIINFISSLSLLIYIFHENYFVREYLRPNIWIYIYKNYGYNNVVLMDLTLSALVFFISVIVCMLYKILLQPKLYKFSNFLHNFLSQKYNKITEFLVKI